jgi:hypothetical protein
MTTNVSGGEGREANLPMDAISCPFCNAAFASDQPRQVGAKALCPRCGEFLPVHLAGNLPSPAAPPPVSAPESMSGSNRRVALLVVGVMLLMATVGLTLALATVKWRRQNDYRVKRDTSAPPSVLAPGELVGLGFLPEKVNVVAAVQVAALANDRAGRELLESPRPALLELLLGTVEKWTKLTAQDLDHIVLGTEVSDRLPQMTVVVQTRQPYDRSALASALHPSKPTLQRGQPLYRFGLHPGEGMLWCAQPRTLVLLFRLDALKMEDLDAIPLSPREGAATPPQALQALLAGHRVDKQSLIWAAGRLEEADAIEELAAFAKLPTGAIQFLAKIQAFGLSLLSQGDLELIGHLQTGEEKTTRWVQEQLQGLKVGNLKPLKVAVPPPEVIGPAGRWVTLQMRGNGPAMREILGQWGSAKER